MKDNASAIAAHQPTRDALRQCRRIVVKIGSRVLANTGAGRDMFENIAEQLAIHVGPVSRALPTPPTAAKPPVLGALTAPPHAGPQQRRKSTFQRRFVIVSSGAIALGMARLGMSTRPRNIDGLQAAAATGQGLLMQRWGQALQRRQLSCAQVLLSHADLCHRERVNNARAALARLVKWGVVPIINENDAVAVDEIRFGDNDELAAMVAPLCDADLLVLLSDVEGLLDGQRRVPFVPRVNDEVRALIRDGTSAEGRGGMHSKLEAARRATLSGSHVVIACANEPAVVSKILSGEDVGTLLPALTKRLSNRKHWIAYTLRPRGVAMLDDGAAAAIGHGGHSVLCVGVVGVRGTFAAGDAISVTDLSGREIARGLSRLSATDAAALAGASGEGVLVHRDDLVVVV